MKTIAFVNSEYQQNILFAICLQEGIKCDIVFIRKNIVVHKAIQEFARDVVLFDLIPFSWRSITRYYNAYKDIILPHINLRDKYRVFTWTLTDYPVIRLLLNNLKDKEICLFEDGAGSYHKRGFLNINLGTKDFLVTAVILIALRGLSRKIKVRNPKQMTGFSLYPNCFPDYKIINKNIDHKYFQKVVMNYMGADKAVNIKKGSKIFIQQAYIEQNILNEEEYIKIHAEALTKIKKLFLNDHEEVIWKLHPWTSIEDESRRVEKISTLTGVDIQVFKERINVEYLACFNRGNNIKYFSLGSASLYVIHALLNDYASVFFIENKTLEKRVPLLKKIKNHFNSIGIKIV
ncbi:MAG: polysialyltransferase family glycosyltransferase [bacterium]